MKSSTAIMIHNVKTIINLISFRSLLSAGYSLDWIVPLSIFHTVTGLMLYQYLQEDSLIVQLMDEGTIKTQNFKCRLYWDIIEFIDWK
jgi:hypothetical protein